MHNYSTYFKLWSLSLSLSLSPLHTSMQKKIAKVIWSHSPLTRCWKYLFFRLLGRRDLFQLEWCSFFFSSYISKVMKWTVSSFLISGWWVFPFSSRQCCSSAERNWSAAHWWRIHGQSFITGTGKSFLVSIHPFLTLAKDLLFFLCMIVWDLVFVGNDNRPIKAS